MNKNKQLLVLSAFTILLIVSFGLIKISLAQSNTTTQANTEIIDAIGVRVLPNPNHYSIARWYQSQGFYGSPQSLIVDGYEAIRDGRTVYVSAANIVDKNVYTNIYLISYNQDPSEKTVDILGQIVSRWKFNSNLENSDSENQATCSISVISCVNDSDCGPGKTCALEGPAQGSCQLQMPKNCRSDSDCPANFFCDSDKAKITRDMKRIGRLGEMKEALANYYRAQGNYPLLAAGTYLANKSVSLWPSWQQVLLGSIAVSPNFIDPINRLGACPGFDAKTCWDINENRFYSSASDSDSTLTLPAGSYAMVYGTDSEGANYNLCATLESRDPSLNYNFVGSNLNASLCVSDIGVNTSGLSNNNLPVLVDYNLSGQAGKEFNGYIKVNDADNDPLKWEIVKGNANWGTWSADAFRIIDTSNKFQKKISASLAPNTNASFPITLRISDSRGGVLEENLLVDIQDYGVFIEAQNAVHVLDKNVPLLYNFYVSGDNLNNPPNVNFTKISGPSVPPFFNLSPATVLTENRYQITFRAELNPATYQFPENTDFEFDIIVKDKNNKEFKKRFNLRLISEKPILQFSCPNKTRAGQNYSCLLGQTNYFGRGFSYSISDQPSELKIVNDEGEAEAYISGRAYASSGSGANQITNHSISVVAKSDYGATTTKKFNLTVNNYCGDGALQAPNSEGRGGPNNDGYEQCDGLAGTTKIAADSANTKQYACSTYNTNTPLEITTNGYCIFKSSLSGGGYCGDSYCQTKYETKTNCSQDCSDGSDVLIGGACSYDADCEIWQECNQIMKRCEVAYGSCDPNFQDRDCVDGFKCNFETNKCEPKIFDNLETINIIKFKEGDATRAGKYYYQRNYTINPVDDDYIPYFFDNQQITEAVGTSVKICNANTSNLSACTIVEMSAPYCLDDSDQYYTDKSLPIKPLTTNINCPLGYENLLMLGREDRKTGDTCYDNDIDNACATNWCGRYQYSCDKNVEISRRVGDSCRATLGSTKIDGIMNAEGKCILTDF